MDDRLNKLEMLSSDQTKMMEDLSREMFHQQRDITRLSRRIKELEEKIESMSSSNEIGGPERPPHY